MADYQHVVAVHADVARRKKRNWTEVEEPQFGEAFIFLFSLLLEKWHVKYHVWFVFPIKIIYSQLSEKGGLIDLDEDDVMMILPPLFAPKDVPENLV